VNIMARDGYPFVSSCVLAALLLWGFGQILDNRVLYIFACFVLALGVFFAYFFRDPERRTDAGDDDILSPGDGRVVSIVEEEENEFFRQRVRRVSVFLSVFDVHINRIPIDGNVTYLKYRPGSFKAAFKEEASAVNEQTVIGITDHEKADRKVLFKQIAGVLARRIVFQLGEGQTVRRGDRFGLIRFGSRVDIYLPPGAELLVEKGRKVKGGFTKIGRFRNET